MSKKVWDFEFMPEPENWKFKNSEICSICGTKGMYEITNKSGKIIIDTFKICKKCEEI